MPVAVVEFPGRIVQRFWLPMALHVQLDKAPVNVEQEEATVVAVVGPGPEEAFALGGAEFQREVEAEIK